jgi:pilus assembly protein CpaB
MKPGRIILLIVALIAGGLAAYLATSGGGPAPEVVTQTEVVEEAKVQILVAKEAIGMAERLSATNTEWQDWPEGSVRPEYVTIAAMPNAQTDLAGTVARFEFFPGEPIREDKLIHSEQGYLSAVLAKGMRGVSIRVNANSSSGGFIVPNDRVDVVLTRGSPAGQISQVILFNVRVLAIGQRLGEKGATGAPADPDNPRAEIFSDQTIATLELDPSQAETLINAAAIGELSLTLRSVADFNEAVDSVKRSTNEPIRVIRYGNEASVLTSATNTASIDPEPAPEPEPEPFNPMIAPNGPPAGALTSMPVAQ